MKKFILVITFFIFLVSCKNEEVTTEVIDPIEIIFLTESEAKINSEVQLRIQIMQGEEKINDATSVEFEIWQEDVLERKIMKANFIENGIYQAVNTFSNIGEYHIVAHTIARNMHVMPEYVIHIKE